ncbi:MAG: AsmA family protein, partial [Sphingomonas sp.]
MKRALIVGGIVVVAIPAVAIGAAAWFLNGDAVKARLVEQVRRSTGRELTVAGPVTLGWSLSPTIALSDLSLSNPPGFARPQMAHVDRLDVQLALAPLLHREIDVRRIAIVRPSLQLERNAAGQPNWDFRPPAAPAAAPTTPSQPGADRFRLMVGSVDVTNATVAYGAQTVTVPHVAYDPDTGRVDGSLMTGGTRFALGGTAGPIAATAYPIDLHLNGDGLAASLTGTSAAATLSMTAADLAALSPLVGRPLPSVRDLTVSAALPGPGALRVHAGVVTLGAVSLQQADLTAASLNDPVTLT